MDVKRHSHPDQLERYAFLWSETRLAVAAAALFMGGIPVLYSLLPFPPFFGLVRLLLTLGWLISGLASGYLFYRWYYGDRSLFGNKKRSDLAAFMVSVVSGFNLGIAGLIGRNIGMAVFPLYGFFVIAGLAYLAAGTYLFRRWKESDEKIFK